jgi:hypothetical protein
VNKQINDLETFFPRSINQSDQLRALAAVESSFKQNFLKQKETQIRKLLALKDLHDTTATPKAIHGCEKFVLRLYEHFLTESEESMLKRGLNFAVTN